VGVTLQRRLVELVATVRATVLVKPLRGLTVIVDWPVVLVVTETLVGFPLIAKSWTW
jgi:hypothetical protein